MKHSNSCFDFYGASFFNTDTKREKAREHGGVGNEKGGSWQMELRARESEKREGEKMHWLCALKLLEDYSRIPAPLC